MALNKNYQLTFHKDVVKPQGITKKFPIALLSEQVKQTIKQYQSDNFGLWLQDEYYFHITGFYLFLYTEEGHRIDVWL